MTRPPGRPTCHIGPSARRGGVYVLVLLVSVVVAITAIAAIAVQRSALAASRLRAQQAAARQHAQSAVSIGAHDISSDTSWRTRPEQWLSDAPVGLGSLSLFVTDPADGDLGDDPEDSVRLRGVGRQGIARAVVEVDLVAIVEGLAALDLAIVAGGNMSVSDAAVLADDTLHSNSTISAQNSSVSSGLTAVGAITTIAYTGTKAPGVSPVTLPGAECIDSYVGRGTPISSLLLPMDGLGRALNGVLLSPIHNPYGLANADGIYVIDCLGLPLSIRNSRVLGTLVLLNSPASSLLEGSVRFDPVSPESPVLLVRGHMQIRCSSTSLSEISLNTNFNPTGAPYQSTTDSDRLDTYRSEIRGLVFVTGDLVISQAPTFDGPVIALGAISITGTPTLYNDGSVKAAAPTGFRAPVRMMFADGTFRRSAD